MVKIKIIGLFDIFVNSNYNRIHMLIEALKSLAQGLNSREPCEELVKANSLWKYWYFASNIFDGGSHVTIASYKIYLIIMEIICPSLTCIINNIPIP